MSIVWQKSIHLTPHTGGIRTLQVINRRSFSFLSRPGRLTNWSSRSGTRMHFLRTMFSVRRRSRYLWYHSTTKRAWESTRKVCACLRVSPRTRTATKRSKVIWHLSWDMKQDRFGNHRFAFKSMNFVVNMMNCGITNDEFALKSMGFVYKTMDLCI